MHAYPLTTVICSKWIVLPVIIMRGHIQTEIAEVIFMTVLTQGLRSHPPSNMVDHIFQGLRFQKIVTKIHCYLMGI